MCNGSYLLVINRDHTHHFFIIRHHPHHRQEIEAKDRRMQAATAPGPPKPNVSKMLYMLPLFFLANKVIMMMMMMMLGWCPLVMLTYKPASLCMYVQITYTDDLVNILRITYYVVQLTTLYLAYVYIKQKVCHHPTYLYDPSLWSSSSSSPST